MVLVAQEGGEQPLALQSRMTAECVFREAREHPDVQAILERFPGAKIDDVRDARNAVTTSRKRVMKNLGEMMKQVQEMQTRMQDMQAKLEQTTVTGQSGGGLVKVTLNGKGALTSAARSIRACSRPRRRKFSKI